MNKKRINSETIGLIQKIDDFKLLNVKLTEKQYTLYQGLQKHKISTITGPPGTSKTFTACWVAIKAL